MSSIHSLLEQLGWPGYANDDRGTLTFTASTGDLETQRSTSAALLVGHDKITVRIRSAMNGAGLEPHLEVQWSLCGQDARLIEFVKDGETQDLDQDAALAAWQNGVNRLGVQPKFQQMAPRRTPELPTRQPGL